MYLGLGPLLGMLIEKVSGSGKELPGGITVAQHHGLVSGASLACLLNGLVLFVDLFPLNL